MIRILSAISIFTAATALAQTPSVAQLEPGQTCALVTQANAEASAGTANINHDGTRLAGQPAVDISKGFQGIPRSAQPKLTASQQRILECTYHLPEANADMPYTLFIPSTYNARTPNALIVDLHGLNITPLQQILFDGTTDWAEKYGFIVLAPMGFSVSGGWSGRYAGLSKVGCQADAAQSASTFQISNAGVVSGIRCLPLLAVYTFNVSFRQACVTAVGRGC